MKTKDLILCIVVLSIWSSSSSLVSIFTYKTTPIIVTCFVTFLSTLILSFQLLNKKNRILLKEVGIKELCKLIFPAILGLYLYPMSYFIGISGSTPIKANILNYLWPLIAFITSKIISRKKLETLELIAMIFATLGGYTVLFFNNSIAFDTTFISKYNFIAFLGAIFYGVYTAIIEYFIPKLRKNSSLFNRTDSEKNNLPVLLRIYIMVLISFLLYIPVLLFYLFHEPTKLYSTFIVIFKNPTNTIAFIFYSLINFTIAHLLWNKLNKDNNITLTSSMAFIIPLVSTIVLSVSSKTSIGFAPSIGLVLIVISIIINNRKQINSINATFVSIIILIILLGITPSIKNRQLIENSKFFLEIVIALFSIYYGFVMNRVINDIKNLEHLVDTLHIHKYKLTLKQKKSLEKLEKKINESKKVNKIKEYDTLGFELPDLLPKNLTSNDEQVIINQYYDLYRCSNQALSLSEWLIIIILSILIIFLCFIVCDKTLLSSIIVISIGATICLCISSLYEYEIQKKKLLNNL